MHYAACQEYFSVHLFLEELGEQCKAVFAGLLLEAGK
jgi:hypothetical protein